MAKMKVSYVGLSTHRVITAAELRGRGIEVPSSPLTEWQVRQFRSDPLLTGFDPTEDLIWSPQNEGALTIEVSDGLENLLRGEGHFTIVAPESGEAVAEGSGEDAPAVIVANEPDRPQQRSRAQ